MSAPSSRLPFTAAAAVGLAHAQVEDSVRFPGTGRRSAHAVGEHLPIDRHHAAQVADAQAVAEDLLAPGKPVRGALDRDHFGDVGRAHRPDQYLRQQLFSRGGHRQAAAPGELLVHAARKLWVLPRLAPCRPGCAAGRRDGRSPPAACALRRNDATRAAQALSRGRIRAGAGSAPRCVRPASMIFGAQQRDLAAPGTAGVASTSSAGAGHGCWQAALQHVGDVDVAVVRS